MNEEKLDTILNNTGEIRTDIAIIKNDIGHMKTDMDRIETVHQQSIKDIQAIKVDMAEMGWLPIIATAFVIAFAGNAIAQWFKKS